MSAAATDDDEASDPDEYDEDVEEEQFRHLKLRGCHHPPSLQALHDVDSLLAGLPLSFSHWLLPDVSHNIIH